MQLSMLPQKIPKHKLCDIDVFMKTATEVGGDYYDFHLARDSTLTVVIGDATGYGMKAGTMVTAIKSLFGTYDESVEIPSFFKKCSKIIKGMNLGHLFMAMKILKIKTNKIIASSAGMPQDAWALPNSRQVNTLTTANIKILFLDFMIYLLSVYRQPFSFTVSHVPHLFYPSHLLPRFCWASYWSVDSGKEIWPF